jgi:hypothetical protein
MRRFVMTVTAHRLGQTPAPHAAAGAEGVVDDAYAGARWRLTLAVLWVAGLIAWGSLSYLATGLPSDGPSSAAARSEQSFDGPGY